ncbi:MAG: hypothetical protein ABR553_05945 [Gammaproteobacteria bacterium]
MDVKTTVIALSVSAFLLGSASGYAATNSSDEEDSVYRWGRWEVLAPAAGVEEVIAFAPAGINDLGRCEAGANCPEPTPEPTPGSTPGPTSGPTPPPVTEMSCEAGQPCGFARVGGFVENEEEPGTVEDFELVLDEETGSLRYRVAPGTSRENDSGDQAAIIGERLVVTTDDRRALRGAIQRLGEGGDPVLVQGPWQHGDRGEFVWGVAATIDQMNALIGGLGSERIATYSGATFNGGSVSMSVDFNNSTWSGDFNGRFAFSASGEVVGSGFVSTAITTPQVSGLVDGGFVNAGNNAIGRYDVLHTTQGRDADVFNAGLETGLVVVPAAQ